MDDNSLTKTGRHMNALIKWFKDARISDVDQIGGKNASLGEMIHALQAERIKVPGGFATTGLSCESVYH